jgi:hypothetical protein
MKYAVFGLAVCVVVALIACGDSSTGSMVFVAEELIISGNPAILGDASTGNFVNVEGIVDSQLGIALTGLKVRVRVLDANRVELGVQETLCTPGEINPGGSCTFLLGVSLGEVPYLESREIEITPLCDQGVGTVLAIPVLWQSS